MSLFLFATVIDMVTEVKKGQFHEILYADNLVLTNDSTEGIERNFANWKDSLESIKV